MKREQRLQDKSFLEESISHFKAEIFQSTLYNILPFLQKCKESDDKLPK